MLTSAGNRQCAILHRSLLHLTQVPPQRHGEEELLRRKIAHSWVKISTFSLPSEDEATLQFYNEFASSLAKAEVRPDSSRGDKEAAMNEYNSIAFNYEDQGDFVTASYFYQKVVELANSCKVVRMLFRIDSSNLWPCWAWESATIRGRKETAR